MGGRTIYCHPDSLAVLHKSLGSGFGPGDVRFPLPVFTSPHLPRWHKRWVPPRGRFWECEQSDRPWCEAIGWGRWEDDTRQPFFVTIGPPDYLEPIPVTVERPGWRHLITNLS